MSWQIEETNLFVINFLTLFRHITASLHASLKVEYFCMYNRFLLQNPFNGCNYEMFPCGRESQGRKPNVFILGIRCFVYYKHETLHTERTTTPKFWRIK